MMANDERVKEIQAQSEDISRLMRQDRRAEVKRQREEGLMGLSQRPQDTGAVDSLLLSLNELGDFWGKQLSGAKIGASTMALGDAPGISGDEIRRQTAAGSYFPGGEFSPKAIEMAGKLAREEGQARRFAQEKMPEESLAPWASEGDMVKAASELDMSTAQFNVSELEPLTLQDIAENALQLQLNQQASVQMLHNKLMTDGFDYEAPLRGLAGEIGRAKQNAVKAAQDLADFDARTAAERGEAKKNVVHNQLLLAEAQSGESAEKYEKISEYQARQQQSLSDYQTASGTYFAAIETATNEILTKEDPSAFRMFGFTDEKGEFSPGKMATTLISVAGILGNAAMTVATKGQLPMFVPSLIMQGIRADLDAQKASWRAGGEKISAVSNLFGYYTKKFNNEQLAESAMMETSLKKVSAFWDMQAKHYQEGVVGETYKLAAIDAERMALAERQKATQNIATIVSSNAGKQAAVLDKASSAQLRKMQADSSKYRLMAEMTKPETEKSFSLNSESKNRIQTAGTFVRDLHQTLFILDQLESEGSGKLMRWVDSQELVKRYGATSWAGALDELGQKLGRLQARNVDVGNLAEKEQEFWQERGWSGGMDIGTIRERVMNTLKAMTDTLAIEYQSHRGQAQDVIGEIIGQMTWGQLDGNSITEALNSGQTTTLSIPQSIEDQLRKNAGRL